MDPEQGEPLELDAENIVGFEDDDPKEDGGEEQPVFGFADDEDDEPEETPAIRRLREHNKLLERQLREARRAPVQPNDDPEPAIPPRPRIEALDYDQDKFDAAVDERDAAVREHADWERRNAERKSSQERLAEEQGRKVEQQRASLGVSDYEERAASVRDVLTEQQLAVLINAADNAPKLLYALGRSPSRLTMLASEDNLAKFAASVGRMEREVKEMKRKAPAPEARVRGATGSLQTGADKHLAALEREADKTGDRSAIAAYKAQQRSKQRAA